MSNKNEFYKQCIGNLALHNKNDSVFQNICTENKRNVILQKPTLSDVSLNLYKTSIGIKLLLHYKLKGCTTFNFNSQIYNIQRLESSRMLISCKDKKTTYSIYKCEHGKWLGNPPKCEDHSKNNQNVIDNSGKQGKFNHFKIFPFSRINISYSNGNHIWCIIWNNFNSIYLKLSQRTKKRKIKKTNV
ncbi:hypothetical protein A3Q56_06999 [Intoshia linei]|uniref:Uncharacterized protein n=1 Tax=Intoshia linei TaxID=1819745 RepID=A0A177AV51_9BILA|nr:hypothetical protein A3Q56_06999 [Intoshia linei]